MDSGEQQVEGHSHGTQSRRLWRIWVAAGGWWAVMFTLTHWPRLGEGGGFDFEIPHADKIAHFGLFCGWFLLWSWALAYLRWTHVRMAATLLILGMIYAAVDESTQAFVPGRTPSWLDFGADTLGLIVGWMIVLALHRSHRGTSAPGRS